MKQTTSTTPKHVAIIMDGNRRWAREHKMEAFKGHEYVANKIIEELTEAAIAEGIQYLTLWAFSTENWNREEKEVAGLMNLFRQSFTKSAKTLHEKGVRLNVIGDMSRFPADIQENVVHWLKESENNSRITVTFALNYGGRDELLRAFDKALEDTRHKIPFFAEASKGKQDTNNPPAGGQTSTNKQKNEYPISNIQYHTFSESEFAEYLDTKNMPDPDLIIRPGGEKRLSGYLPWQSVYSELYFTDILMPDFNAEQLKIALEDYKQRQRRFGR